MSKLPDNLPIVPFTRPVRGSVTLPGSKSITNRALILAALANGKTTLRGALFSRDTRIMVAALRQLGFTVDTDETALTISIKGLDGEIPKREAKLDIGNAGTAARFLTAFVCLCPDGVYHFDGDEAMRRRPIGALLDALETQGANASARSFPFTLRTTGLRGGDIKIDASESSQMLSALLMVASFARNQSVIYPVGSIRMPFVEMTAKLMTRFTGLGLSPWPDGTYRPLPVTPARRYRSPEIFQIEPDASAASYFLTLPMVTGGSVYLPGLRTDHSLQGDIKFAEVLRSAGVNVADRLVDDPQPSTEIDESYQVRKRSIGVDSTFKGSPKPKHVTQDFNEFSDTFLTLAAIAPLLDGPTKISGIAHTRKQETDRVAGMARELKKLGQHVIETEDALEIHPRPLIPGVEIETYHDHRFAMSFGILGCFDLLKNGRPWLTIKDPACCSKTFPHFFDLLASLRAGSH